MVGFRHYQYLGILIDVIIDITFFVENGPGAGDEESNESGSEKPPSLFRPSAFVPKPGISYLSSVSDYYSFCVSAMSFSADF